MFAVTPPAPPSSSPQYEVSIERQVPVPVRDGTVLRADVYRPQAPGRYPVLIERVGYELTGRSGAAGDYFARRGYALVAQNVRGAYASGGALRPFRDDG